jgi:drug/metabolite transporter (DMT)-like permease
MKPEIFKPQISWLTLLVGCLAAACWGISTVITKSILNSVAPLPLLTVQLLCSNLLLWAAVLWGAKHNQIQLPKGREAIGLAWPGLLQPGLSFTAAVAGLALTTASVEALIWSLETVFIVGLAWLLLREQVGLSLLGLSLLGVLGVGLVTATADATVAGPQAWVGNLLILLGTFCAALYTVLVRFSLKAAEPLLLTALNQLMGLLCVLTILSLSSPWLKPQFNWSLQTWELAALSGLMLHALPFWAFNWVLKRVPASLAAFFLMLIPLFTLSGAFFFLQERLTVTQWLGTGIILAAMAGVARLEGRSQEAIPSKLGEK